MREYLVSKMIIEFRKLINFFFFLYNKDNDDGIAKRDESFE